MTEQVPRSCILIELTDGSTCAFKYPDEESAESWYQECREEWDAERTVVFNVRPRTSFESSTRIYDGDEVAHIERTTRDDADGRSTECWDAFIFG